MVATKRALKRKGAAMVEYAILVGAVALIGILGMSVLGRKTSDIIGTLAVILPGVESREDVSLHNASLIEITTDGTTFRIDSNKIAADKSVDRLNANAGIGGSQSDSQFVIQPS
jgi:Flp pilus assembly pilin Flp